jgi:hypothetical protein
VWCAVGATTAAAWKRKRWRKHIGVMMLKSAGTFHEALILCTSNNEQTECLTKNYFLQKENEEQWFDAVEGLSFDSSLEL